MTEQWTSEEVDKALALRLAGETARIIAGAVGRSRNAVCGKMFRLGITKPENRPMHVPRPVTLPVPEPKQATFSFLCEAQCQDLLDLGPNDCRWPVGDPLKPGFHFCGARSVAHKPYCAEHMKKAYVPVNPNAEKTLWKLPGMNQ